MRAVSLFAGIGGFDLGMQRAGITTVAACELDKAARGVLADRFPKAALFRDVRGLSGDQLRAVGFRAGDIITGGFPCQDLSVAGKRGGLAAPRSGLFYEIVRLAEETRPGYLILENVPGLLTSNGGRDMAAVVGTLVECGFRVAWRVVDAQFFGLAQRRRRVLLVASAGGGAGPEEILLESESGGGGVAASRGPVEGPAVRAVVSTLQGGGQRGHRVDAEAAAGGHLIPVVYVKASRAGRGPESWRRSGLAGTLDAGGQSARTATAVEAGVGVRRLMPVECERLQGFPDGWTVSSWGRPQSDAARYRQLGNAVAVPVVEWAARRLVARVSPAPGQDP